MKTFINKTVLIFSIFSIGILSFIFFIHFTIKHTSKFNIPKKKTYLILGHSHPSFAFNDDLLPNFKNLSKSGESYFNTYQKIKEVIPNNNIKTVFIEYSNNLIDKNMDEWIWGYEKMNAYFPWHSSFMEKDDMLFLYKKNTQGFINSISISTRNNLTRILCLDFITLDNRYGGHSESKISDVKKLIKKRNNTNINDTNETQEISIENLIYLEKIINYCSINNITVFLIRSPQHKYFPKENEKLLYSLKKTKI